MASPQSTTSHDDSKKNLEQITFRFCAECSNMLYPKEDADAHKLQFTCRTCQYTEEATSTCVFRNVLNNAAGETAGVTQDVGSDPTVGKPPRAASCAPSTPPHAQQPFAGAAPAGQVFFCLCCGGIIACPRCKNQLYPASPMSPTSPTSPTSPGSPGSLDYLSSPEISWAMDSIDTMDAVDLADENLQNAFRGISISTLANEFEGDYDDIDFYIV